MKLGIDLGSSTAKFAIVDRNNKIVFSEYGKHNGKPVEKIIEFLIKMPHDLKKEEFTICITGTAGMGLSQRVNFPFVQEVLAVSKSVKTYYPHVAGVIEIGGEDAKFIHFSKNGIPDMRMNGSCAGGTGSFIEQMAALLDTELIDMNELAEQSSKHLAIASRCGVFAKTDVQALFNQGQSKSDIAKGVLSAVAVQYVSTLIAGADLDGDVIFAGGPLTYFSELREAFKERLKIAGDFVLPENSQVFIAIGAALNSDTKDANKYDYEFILNKIKDSRGTIQIEKTLDPLFKSKEDYEKFSKRHKKNSFIENSNVLENDNLFVGIDAGSTTTKMALLNEKGEIVANFYENNKGKPLDVVKKGFKEFGSLMNQVKAVYATGYGEEIVSHAFKLSGGVVETFAHYRAGLEFSDDISYILDIGGQDIKAISIDNGVVADIQLNEACSSGTGSFIETFSKTMGLTLDEFVEKSLFSKKPIDLGSRCSVFMNSKVKDALREGYLVDDVSAGLCFSVVKNALHKVVRIQDSSQFGDKVLVQGGTFKNDAVLRAFELLTNKEVIRVEQAHLMGALGSALFGLEQWQNNLVEDYIWNSKILDEELVSDKKYFKCKGCGNDCNISKFTFNNGESYFTGQKCEKFFSNKSEIETPTPNFFTEKYQINYTNLIEEEYDINENLPTIGLPLVLENYEHFIFYHTIFKTLGFKLEITHWTNDVMYNKGLTTQIVDNICFPAKVVNGHIEELNEKGVDRIFMPVVLFEQVADQDQANSYNCPVVTGYPEVAKSIYDKKEYAVIDSPIISFINYNYATQNMFKYVKQFGISKKDFNLAAKKAIAREDHIKEAYLKVGREVVNKAVRENKPLLIIAGRPYHIDPLVNHGLMDLANSLGAYVINEEVASELFEGDLSGISALTQWTYHNRLYKAGKWLKDFDYDKVGYVQLTSFGCGPDAVTTDEIKSIVQDAGKPYINIKMDEMANLGAVKIRLKSLLFTLQDGFKGGAVKRKFLPNHDKNGPIKTVIAPYFAETYNEVLVAVFHNFGYKLIFPKTQVREVIDEGLKYVNNDMCYPAIITVGDIIKELKSGKHDTNNVIVTMSETGGQCRASNYMTVLKKAMIDAGFENVPIASLNTSAGEDGFGFNTLKMLKYFAIGFSAADAILRMKLSTRPYEINKGDTEKLVTKVSQELYEMLIDKPSKKNLIKFIKKTVIQFNDIEVYHRKYPKVGIVGEIYLKTNNFSNNYLAKWLEDRGYEVELPGFVKFLSMEYFNNIFNYKENVKKSKSDVLRGFALKKTFDRYVKITEKEMRNFTRYHEESKIEDNIDKNILTTAIQFGESWLLPLEVMTMAQRGTKYVVALQPWGCISNHIIAKGMYKKIKKEFPDLSFLALDFESGSTNVNIFNRLELFLNA